MSVIGPRPGLWNQDVLTAERDKYGANDVKPGLTGWAQINGRDELDISDKATIISNITILSILILLQRNILVQLLLWQRDIPRIIFMLQKIEC